MISSVSRREFREIWIMCCVTAWLIVLIAGFASLIRYASREGMPAQSPSTWPRSSALPTGDRARLVMLLHPRCACSRASLAELDRLMARVGDRVRAQVVMVEPTGVVGPSDLEQQARHIGGVSVWHDAGGVEAQRFGAVTSGQVFLYDRAGNLLFHGGITGARGHEGANAGSDEIAAILSTGARANLVTTSVFGCKL
jgi:hypothetical protein